MVTSQVPDAGTVGAEPARGQGSAGGRLRHAWWAGPIALVGLAVPRLGQRELWLDETFSLAATHDLLGTWRETGGTMALYYLVLTPWSWVSHDASWLRLLSLALMAAAVAVLGLTVRRQHGARVAAWATLLAGCSYLVVHNAAEARAYALVALLTASSWYALDRSLDEGGRWWAGVHLLTAVALPLAHGLAPVQLVAQLGAVAAGRTGAAALRRVLAAGAVAGVVLAALATLGISEVGDWMDPLDLDGAATLVRVVTNAEPALAALLVAAALAGAVLLVREPLPAGPTDGAGLAGFRRWTPVMWGPGAIVVVLVTSLARPIQLGRYSVAAVFGMATLWAVVADRAARRTPATGLVAGALLLLLVVTGQPPYDPHPTPWRDATDVVADGARDGDALAFGTPDRRVAFEAAWAGVDGPPDLALVAGGEPLGDFDRFADEATATELAAAIASQRRVWLVDQHVDRPASRFDELLDDPALRARLEVVRTWELDEYVRIVLLVTR